MRLIPAIDLRAGKCVRLYQGDFGAPTRYAIAPGDLARRYAAYGASWMHVVDLDGAFEGAPRNLATIAALAAGDAVKLQVGGGVRSLGTLKGLLAAGVARVVLGSVALEEPQRVRGWIERFGAERLCLAFDVRLDAAGEPRVHTRGWRTASEVSLWAALQPYRGSALRHVLCTDIARDGALAGPNLLLYQAAVARLPQLAWQASGGVRDARDLQALAATGVAAAISGKALLEEHIPKEELAPFLPDASFPASTSVTVRS